DGDFGEGFRASRARGVTLERDDYSSNHHPALPLCLSMFFSRKSPTLYPSPACGGGKGGGFGIMLSSFPSATSSTRWLSAFFRMRSARWRVGRMFSCRLRRLIRRQMDVAVSTASLSLSVA